MPHEGTPTIVRMQTEQTEPKRKGLFGRLIVYPLLFAAYPILFLFAQNTSENVTVGAIFRPMLLVVAATCVFWLVLTRLYGDATKAAVVTTVWVFLFFSYGHIDNVIYGAETVGGDAPLLLAWAVLAVAAPVLVARSKGNLAKGTAALNVIAIVLVGLNVVPIVSHAFTVRELHAPPLPEIAGLPEAAEVEESAKRDIYYIVFDRYANEQTLEAVFDHDNGDMLRFLEDQGFYVAHDSAANHLKTAHSLASSLNMTYLNYMAESISPRTGDFRPVFEMLRGFRVAEFLKSLGYRYYHIGSWWNPTEEDPSADVNYSYESLSEFSNIFLETTLWRPLSERFGIASWIGFRPTQQRRVDYQFEKVAGIRNDPAPTFTFMHVLLPHPPYVFDRNGGLVTEEEAAERTEEENYVDQLIYTNERIKEMVRGLLAGPESEDPIVIIQSDEGPHPARLRLPNAYFNWFRASEAELREKLLILNTYYLPGVGDDSLYPTISPINSFRVIFNEYFGADLPLEPDRVWVYKQRQALLEFKDVTERVRNGSFSNDEIGG